MISAGRKILEWEARRDEDGNLSIYKLPSNDGGGSYEVAGINEKYHPKEAAMLAGLIKNKQFKEAERLAACYIQDYTDAVSSWTNNSSIDFFLRDTCFNRGPKGAAKILQKALGVVEDGKVGPITLAALKRAGIDPDELLNDLRRAREKYEDQIAGSRPNLRQGLVNRWDNALDYSKILLRA